MSDPRIDPSQPVLLERRKPLRERIDAMIPKALARRAGVLVVLWRRPLARLGIVVAVGLVALALFADVIASDKPIAARIDGELYVLPAWFDPPALRAHDNQSLEASLAAGDWAWMPLVPFGPLQSSIDGRVEPLSPPSGRHPLGTDDRGRDVLARVAHGARISLSIGLSAVGLYLLIGVTLGGLAGFYGGIVDALVSRAIEVLLSFPSLVFLLAVQGIAASSGVLHLVLVLGLTRWTDVARLVRAEVLRAREQDYVLAAHALGVTPLRILLRHVLPASLGPAFVVATFGIAAAVLVESALSFLGFGPPPPTPTWGELLAQAREHRDAWWLAVFPGLCVFLTALSFHLIGESLRDAYDPRLRTGRAKQ
ncbi:MAG: ABC transporter permease [Deltaproteobacteria bacterium]|nr:ABC transporter permease [Deltaproteobacteria bacterium]